MTDDDITLLVGCRAIAQALKLTERQVNSARENDGLRFIWREPGLGVVTTRGAARRYLEARARGDGVEAAISAIAAKISNDSAGDAQRLPKTG